MKILLLTSLILLSAIIGFAQQPNKGKQIPDIPGYHTLKCDFHMHTIFSDGKVWPTVRVQEALSEGLDAIALTDHIGKQKPDTDVVKDLNRAWEIALEQAEGTEIIIIKGTEITFPMPPGHVNALFLTDAEKLDTKKYMEAFEEAKKQDAFFIWNHSNWKSPNAKYEQDGIAIWFDAHNELLEKGMLHGLEVVNGVNYNLEAHNWCLEKGLTMFGNSDIHEPINFDHDVVNSHRPLTLVFAKERTQNSIREALDEGRTAVWFQEILIGKKEFLNPLFHKSVIVRGVSYYEKLAEVILKNESAVDFIMEYTGEYLFFNKTKLVVLKAGEELRLAVKTGEVKETFNLDFKVMNVLLSPEQNLETSIVCKTRKGGPENHIRKPKKKAN